MVKQFKGYSEAENDWFMKMSEVYYTYVETTSS